MAKSRKKLKKAAQDDAQMKGFIKTVVIITIVLLLLLFVVFNGL